MHVVVISLFPEMFSPLTNFGVVGRAFKQDRVKLSLINPREFTHDAHHTVDDRPYGGGAGMVMLAEPLYQSILAAKRLVGSTAKVYYLCPQGQSFNQAIAAEWSQKEAIILLCGRYEGIDQRIIEHHVDACLSIGDYILSGGEMAAMCVLDSVVRLIPGVLGHEASSVHESFSENRLEHPHYTRPESWRGQVIPAVLASGHHGDISRWRQEQSMTITEQLRPDLLNK